MALQPSLTSSSKRLSFGDPSPPAKPSTSPTKQSTQKLHKPQGSGPGRLHARTPSYGKKLAKAGRLNSTQNLLDQASRHQRTKSGTSIPSTSPKSPGTKREPPQPALVKNSSHVNLRKNKSTNTLSRNLSRTQLQRKAGLAPLAPKPRKEASAKQKRFELGDRSSDEENAREDEWEDLATQSPRRTRSNSAKSTQAVSASTGEKVTSDVSSQPYHPHNTSSPSVSPLRYNRSAPNFGASDSTSDPIWSPDPPIDLTQRNEHPRSSRATPAISSISVQASRKANDHDPSSASNRQNDLPPSSEDNSFLGTPNTNKAAANSSSADAGVSHFLSSKPANILNYQRRGSSGSDQGSPSSFLPSYRPQNSLSPEKARMSGGALSAASTSRLRRGEPRSAEKQLPSRTQQRLELQRRETMRTPAPTTPSTPVLANGHRGSFAMSLHSRSSSHGQSRASDSSRSGGTLINIKQDYETAERQLGVVRRFRNPVLEAVGRLKDTSLLELDTASRGGSRKANSRKAWGVRSDVDLKAPGSSKLRSQETDTQARPSHNLTRATSHGPPGRVVHPSSAASEKVRFRRQGSHDDIGLSRSQGSYDGADDDNDDVGSSELRSAADGGLSADAQMMRRIWESRDVYDTVENDQ